MSLKRVVVTGMGAVSPFGRGVDVLFSSLQEGKSGIQILPVADHITGLEPRVAGLVTGVDSSEIPRKSRRSMSPMSVYAFMAAQDSLAAAQVPDAAVTGGRMGVAMGSTLGSAATMQEFFANYLATKSVEQIKSMMFFRIMGHSVAANVAQTLGITGRVLAPSAACSTGCQAIGLGYEAIAHGLQDFMLCGGADEYHPLTSATFDIMRAASVKYNDTPDCTPRPFDNARDGVVCSEGAGVLLLESLDSARQRNAPILAEIKGFATTADPSNIANPASEPLALCMKNALAAAQTRPEQVDYINAHATGTVQGDIAEGHALASVFGGGVPVSSLKGHLGHTMAASGALESIACIAMMRYGQLIPTRNLDTPAPEFSGLRLLQENQHSDVHTIVKNNFALGGINCSLVLGKI